MKAEFSRKIFVKSSRIKFHENPSSCNRVVPHRQADMTKSAFRRFTNAPKKRNHDRSAVRAVPVLSVDHFVYFKYKDTKTVTNSTEQTPSSEISRSPTNRFPAFLNPEISLPRHNSPPFVPILSHMKQSTPSHPNSSMSTLIISSQPQVHLPICRFPADFDIVCICFPNTCHMPRPTHPSCLETPTNLCSKFKIMKLHKTQHSTMCIRKAIRTGLLKTRKEKGKANKGRNKKRFETCTQLH